MAIGGTVCPANKRRHRATATEREGAHGGTYSIFTSTRTTAEDPQQRQGSWRDQERRQRYSSGRDVERARVLEGMDGASALIGYARRGDHTISRGNQDGGGSDSDSG